MFDYCLVPIEEVVQGLRIALKMEGDIIDSSYFFVSSVIRHCMWFSFLYEVNLLCIYYVYIALDDTYTHIYNVRLIRKVFPL